MQPVESVAAFLEARERLPICYALVMNSIWSRWESLTLVALFDTRAMADAFEQACRLPESERVQFDDRSMYLAYREGTLLREFNKPDSGRPHIIPAPIDFDYGDNTHINPTPPATD
jgi:hypothetical protein